MSAGVPALPLGLDPLIAEAKERARRRRLAGVVLILALIALSIGLAVKMSGPDARIVRTAGMSVRVPPGWFITRRPLNGITDPAQRFAISSFPIRAADFRQGNEPVFRPPASGVLVQVDEQLPAGNPGFPPRSAHFRLGRFAPLETFTGHRWAEFVFKLGGRDFYAFVWIGRRADAADTAQVLSLLDTMQAGRT